MTALPYREIEKGANFEICQGPQCLQRLDWTRDALRITDVGYVEDWCVGRLIERWDAFARAKVRFTICHDFWEATGYTSAMRVEGLKWMKANPGVNIGIHFLTRSKLLNMGVTVVALALPGQVTSYAKRQDFDVVMRKLGLPVTISMPEFKPGV